MARDAELRARITAEDDASRVIDKVADKADKLDKTDVDVHVDSSGADKLGASLDSAGEAAGNLPGPLGDVAGLLSGGGGMAAGAGLLATGLFQAAQSAADTALEAKSLAQLTGDSVEEASKLQAVWKSTGADANDLADVVLQMNGTLAQSPELAKQLGINMNDGKTGGERFQQVVGMVNAGLIDATTQSQIFGEEGVRQVSNLSAAVGGDLQSALDNVSDTQIISDKDVAQAQKMKAAFAEVSGAVQGLVTQVGQQLIPALTTVTSILNTPIGKGSLIEVLGGGTISHAQEIWGNLSGSSDDVKGKLDLAADSIVNVEEVAGPAGTAIDQVAESHGFLAEQAEAAAAALQASADALNAEVDAATAAADQQLEVNDAYLKYAEVLKDADASAIDVRDSAIDLAKAQADLYDKQAESNGVVLTSTQRLDNQNEALLNTAATAKGPARTGILDYIASVNQIPPEKMTEIQAAIDAGDLETANRLLDEASATRTAAVNADANTSAAKAELDDAAKHRNATITANVVKGSGWSMLSQAGSGWGYGTTTNAAPTATATAAPRTAVEVDVRVPSGAELARRIGKIRVPLDIQAGLRADRRLAGIRD